jgi:K+-transporting ATPase A subunit
MIESHHLTNVLYPLCGADGVSSKVQWQGYYRNVTILHVLMLLFVLLVLLFQFELVSPLCIFLPPCFSPYM